MKTKNLHLKKFVIILLLGIGLSCDSEEDKAKVSIYDGIWGNPNITATQPKIEANATKLSFILTFSPEPPVVTNSVNIILEGTYPGTTFEKLHLIENVFLPSVSLSASKNEYWLIRIPFDELEIKTSSISYDDAFISGSPIYYDRQ